MTHQETLVTETIFPQNMIFTTGTWTDVVSTGIIYKSKSAANNTPVITIPMGHQNRQTDQTGAKLKDIILSIRATTQNFDAAPTFTLYRIAMDANASATDNIDATTVAISHNAVATADAEDRTITVTVTNPAFDFSTEEKCHYVLVGTFDCGTSTAMRMYAAQANFVKLT